MGVLISSTLFFLHVMLLGFSLLNIYQPSSKRPFFKQRMLELVFGFSLLVMLPYLIGLFGLPINIWIITGISVSFFIITLIVISKKKGLRAYFDGQLNQTHSFKLNKNKIFVLLTIFLFILSSYIYFQGTLQQKYLEDGDPWSYAAQANLVSEQQSYYLPDNVEVGTNAYLKPFPRRLTVLAGLYLQVSDSPNNILKYFFNYFLMIGTLSFILFFNELFSDKSKVFLATLFIVSAPGFVGRFIYENNIGVLLIGACLISTIYLLRGKKEYLWIGGIAFAAQFVGHPATALLNVYIIAGLFISLFIKDFIVDKKKIKSSKTYIYTLMIFIGILLSLTSYLQPIWLYGVDEITFTEGPVFGIYGDVDGNMMNKIMLYNPNYSLKDFAVVKMTGKIDQPIGIGLVLFILLVIGFLFCILKIVGLKSPFIEMKMKGEKKYLFLGFALSLIIIFVLMSLGYKSGLSIFTGRYWPVFTLLGALFFAEFTGDFISVFKNKIVYALLIVLLLYGTYSTSFIQDQSVQMSVWPVHIYSMSDVPGYSYVQSLKPGTTVYPVCRKNGYFVYGLDKKYNYSVTEKHTKIYENLKNVSEEEMFQYLKDLNYEYYIFDSACVNNYGVNNSNKLIQLMINNSFVPKYSDNGFIALSQN